MKLYWVDLPADLQYGANFGYSVHSRRLRSAVSKYEGISMVDTPESADLVIHVTYPAAFEAVPGKRNLAFIQTEQDDVMEPELWATRITKADALVCSCRLSQEVEKKHFRGPVYICPLGVDGERFPYVERKAPSLEDPFVFLFENNWTDSKGLARLLEIWSLWRAYGTMPVNAVLFIRGSGIPEGREDASLARTQRIVFDDRLISSADLHDIYAGAHVFVNTTHGDGWGLTQFQALASGLPSIWSHWSSFPDYLDERDGYPIRKYELKPFANPSDLSKAVCHGACVDACEFIAAMEHVYHFYEEALARGRTAAEHVRREYTWDKAATRFVEICKSVIDSDNSR